MKHLHVHIEFFLSRFLWIIKEAVLTAVLGFSMETHRSKGQAESGCHPKVEPQRTDSALNSWAVATPALCAKLPSTRLTLRRSEECDLVVSILRQL